MGDDVANVEPCTQQDADDENGLRALLSGVLPLGILTCVVVGVYLRSFCNNSPQTTTSPQRRIKHRTAAKHREQIVCYFEQSGNQLEITQSNLILGPRKSAGDHDVEDGLKRGNALILTTTTKPSNDENTEAGAPIAEQRNQGRANECCIICLEPYQEKDVVVWSQSQDCPHIFHRDCFVDYLISHRGVESPCPTCRRQFCPQSIFAE